MSHNWVWDNELKQKFLKFRADCVLEECNELQTAVESQNSEEIIDALIDVCVFAIGTLDSFGADAHKAWDEVLRANMSKEVGIKEGRPNPFGLPDLIKPEGWQGPSHNGNHGDLDDIF
jgi:predicted HAD superfamily Cof-like phosphohydrolase